LQFLHIVPVGDGVSLERLDRLAAWLARAFTCSCHVHAAALDASAAFDANRRQFYSTPLLRALLDKYPDGQRLLGVAAVDLFVPVLTFVFGEAQVGGRAAIVSYHRLREEFYGLPANEDLLSERLIKEAVHELGHTFGLRHCYDWQCVMATSHAAEVLDVKSAEFCAACAAGIIS
jgi:archaemetzincin